MFSVRSLLMLVVTGGAALALCADTAIGVAAGSGYLRLDQSRIYGNGTLFNGSSIETTDACADLSVTPAARLRLGADSAGRAFADRFLLEKGQAELISGTSYRLEALGLHMRLGGPDSRVLVAFAGPGRIQVAALRGTATVSKGDGVEIARVTPGAALELEPQGEAAAPTSISGVLQSVGNNYLLTDNTTRILFQLVGQDLQPFVGKCVEVTGSVDPRVKAAAGVSQVIQVLEIKECSSKAAGKQFLSRTKKVIIAGVVVGAVASMAGIAASRAGKAAVSGR